MFFLFFLSRCELQKSEKKNAKKNTPRGLSLGVNYYALAIRTLLQALAVLASVLLVITPQPNRMRTGDLSSFFAFCVATGTLITNLS
jgi:hypothetical protein